MIFTAIPVELFDQVKLHALLARIPTAYIRSEKSTGVEKKFFSFPKLDDKGFKIKCQADHYYGVAVPSQIACELLMLKVPVEKFDEHMAEFSDPFVVKNFYNAISYGSDIKAAYSYERPYGKNLKGVYQKHFRYGLSCTLEKCQLTMSTTPAAKF